MCGRFTLYSDLAILSKRFNFDGSKLTLHTNFNISPNQQVLVVSNKRPIPTQFEAGYMRWGLIHPWLKCSSTSRGMINARAETISEKPSFKNAFINRRCLVLSDGFYEWKKLGKEKRPMLIQLSNKKPFAFAGIWKTWKTSQGEPIKCCCILTIKSNEMMSSIHERMPVILKNNAETAWLDNNLTNPVEINNIIYNDRNEDLEAREVSSIVNSTNNNEDICIAPVYKLL